jgi:hypothetical protein
MATHILYIIFIILSFKIKYNWAKNNVNSIFKQGKIIKFDIFFNKRYAFLGYLNREERFYLLDLENIT